MKLTDKENTVLADLGINTDYNEHPVEATQTVMKILGTTVAGAKAILRSLEKKGLLETVGDAADEEVIQFTDRGIKEVNKLNPVDDEDMELEDIDDEDEDDLVEAVTMVQQAAKKAKKATKTPKAKKAPSAGGVRTSHADCSHAKSGPEGKIARAKCRKERASAAAK